MSLLCKRTSTRLGPVLLAASNKGLAGLWFEGQQHMPDTSAWREQAHPLLEQAAQQLDDYLAGRRTLFDVPLAPAWGTNFQQSVWRALQGIAYGQTTTYGELAKHLGQPQAARAIGAAVGRNPWSVIVPCHRVLGANGALTGYAGGLERKRALLALEGVV